MENKLQELIDLLSSAISKLEEIKQQSSKTICETQGHAMYSVYALSNEHSNWGLHKCSTCGHEEPWQWDSF